MRVEPDDGEAAAARVASPRIAPTWAQQQPPSTSGRAGRFRICVAICSSRVSSSITAASGYGSGERGGGGHRVASLTPGAGHPHEPGGELAAAAVALVLRVDRDRGQRPAVGAAGAEGAHAVRSHVSLRRTTCIPTRS